MEYRRHVPRRFLRLQGNEASQSRRDRFAIR